MSKSSKSAEEDFLRRQIHENRINAVDPHGSVHQRADPIIVADSHGQL